MWRTIGIVLGTGFLVYAILQIGERVAIERAALFPLLLVAGLAILYSFPLDLATLAFWLVRLENIMAILGSMYEAGRWPIGIYPPWFRVALTRRGPGRVCNHHPGREPDRADGRGDGRHHARRRGIFRGVSRWSWRLGFRSYTGASA